MDANNNSQNNSLFDEILHQFAKYVRFILKKFIPISIWAIIGGSVGLLFTYLSPTKYNAQLSFVVEEGRTSGGGLASLVSQFGIDLGGANNVGLLSGDNILMFLKSSSLTKETLLTPFDSSSNFSLADEYANVYKLRDKWEKNSKINQKIFFPSNSTKPFTRLQDSLLQTIIAKILLKELIVDRPEKKATFITVQTKMLGEVLSSQFCQRLVKNATDRYIQAKTRRQKNNVERLQKRADSIANVLNNKTYANSSDIEKTLDINPATRNPIVRAEVSSRDKLMLTTIYGEVVKNLEISKVQLIQETPTIQVVDKPDLPLVNEKKSKLLYSLGFAIFFAILGIGAIIIKMKYNNLNKNF